MVIGRPARNQSLNVILTVVCAEPDGTRRCETPQWPGKAQVPANPRQSRTGTRTSNGPQLRPAAHSV